MERKRGSSWATLSPNDKGGTGGAHGNACSSVPHAALVGVLFNPRRVHLCETDRRFLWFALLEHRKAIRVGRSFVIFDGLHMF
jgi:hypothetical protein